MIDKELKRMQQAATLSFQVEICGESSSGAPKENLLLVMSQQGKPRIFCRMKAIPLASLTPRRTRLDIYCLYLPELGGRVFALSTTASSSPPSSPRSFLVPTNPRRPIQEPPYRNLHGQKTSLYSLRSLSYRPYHSKGQGNLRRHIDRPRRQLGSSFRGNFKYPGA